MTCTKYFIITKDTSQNTLDWFAEVMLHGGEIIHSWTTNDAIQHLIKWNTNDEKYNGKDKESK